MCACYETEAASAAVRRVGVSQEGAPDFVFNLEARGAALSPAFILYRVSGSS